MKLSCCIAEDFKGNPKLKVTQDSPEITITVYTQDLNLLKSWVGLELEIGPKQ